MATGEIRFFVPGLPAPAGSKRAFYIKSLGRSVITDACKRSKPWQQTVSGFAMEAHADKPLTGPLRLEVVFYMPRPKGHYGSGKNATKIKDSAPRWPATKPDATKLLRAVEDAMTGIIYVDDAQIVLQIVEKGYAWDGRIGAEILVRSLDAREGNTI